MQISLHDVQGMPCDWLATSAWQATTTNSYQLAVSQHVNGSRMWVLCEGRAEAEAGGGSGDGGGVGRGGSHP